MQKVGDPVLQSTPFRIKGTLKAYEHLKIARVTPRMACQMLRRTAGRPNARESNMLQKARAMQQPQSGSSSQRQEAAKVRKQPKTGSSKVRKQPLSGSSKVRQKPKDIYSSSTDSEVRHQPKSGGTWHGTWPTLAKSAIMIADKEGIIHGPKNKPHQWSFGCPKKMLWK